MRDHIIVVQHLLKKKFVLRASSDFVDLSDDLHFAEIIVTSPAGMINLM